MKSDCFEKLCAGIMACRPQTGARTEFSRICQSLKLDRMEADGMLYDEFGMSGEELLRCLYGML